MGKGYRIMEVSPWFWERHRTPWQPDYVCAIKNCRFKKRNGRCGRDVIRLETDERGRSTGRCLDYEPRART